jgi:hypothetical protein
VPSLEQLLDEARLNHDHESHVHALDALARAATVRGDRGAAQDLLEAADRIAVRIRHVPDEADRLDATATRALLH